MATSAVDIVQQIEAELRDKEAKIKAAEIRLAALQTAFADTLQKEQEAKAWLAKNGPVVEKMQRKIREFLKEHP